MKRTILTVIWLTATAVFDKELHVVYKDKVFILETLLIKDSDSETVNKVILLLLLYYSKASN